MGNNGGDLKKQSNKQFVQDVSKMFESWARKNDMDSSVESMMQFFVAHNFMRQSIVNRFRVLTEYEKAIKDTVCDRYPRGNKTHAIWHVENVVPLCESQIKNILRNHSVYFRENRLKF